MPVLRAAWLIAKKDLLVEVRNRELISTVLFFAIACVLVFVFALLREDGMPPGESAANPAPGILWVAIAFSGTLALGRTFERERRGETLRALLLAPVERSAVYLGKLLTVLLLMGAIEVVVVPVVGVLFSAPFGRAPGLLLALLAAGTLGFAAIGTLFAAMLTRVTSRDVMLPVLLYPMSVPVIIAGVMGTAALVAGREPDVATAQTWLAMLVFFDAVFVTIALWLFQPVMSE
jgi:heme exporter protein CcmB